MLSHSNYMKKLFLILGLLFTITLTSCNQTQQFDVSMIRNDNNLSQEMADKYNISGFGTPKKLESSSETVIVSTREDINESVVVYKLNITEVLKNASNGDSSRARTLNLNPLYFYQSVNNENSDIFSQSELTSYANIFYSDNGIKSVYEKANYKDAYGIWGVSFDITPFVEKYNENKDSEVFAYIEYVPTKFETIVNEKGAVNKYILAPVYVSADGAAYTNVLEKLDYSENKAYALNMQ